MHDTRKYLTGLTALAASVAMCAVPLSGAVARHRAHHHGHHAAAKPPAPKLIPAHLKSGYVGAPGYVGGAPGPAVPGLIDIGDPLVGLPLKL